MNSINIVGRLTADIELRRTQSGKAVASYNVATKRPRAKDTTDFIPVVTWEQGAEYLAKYGHRGDVVAISGVLASRKWTDNDGKERTQWEVVSDSVELLSSKKNSEAGGNTTQTQNASYSQPSYAQKNFQQIDIPDAQLPF